jgi:hypothetical protein
MVLCMARACYRRAWMGILERGVLACIHLPSFWIELEVPFGGGMGCIDCGVRFER